MRSGSAHPEVPPPATAGGGITPASGVDAETVDATGRADPPAFVDDATDALLMRVLFARHEQALARVRFREAIIAARNAGHTTREVARWAGVDQGYVSRVHHGHRLETDHPGRTKAVPS